MTSLWVHYYMFAIVKIDTDINKLLDILNHLFLIYVLHVSNSSKLFATTISRKSTYKGLLTK